MEYKPPVQAGPPVLIESVVRLLLPPPTREHVLGDLAERYSTPARYVGEALRRLADFLVHGHPLVYLATLESDLKRRSLASAAPDEATFRDWVGGGSDRQLSIVWQRRNRTRESSLRRAQEALLRADRALKTEPEETHRVTLERLTVAMCHWYR